MAAIEVDNLQMFFNEVSGLLHDLEDGENHDAFILKERLNVSIASLGVLQEGLPLSRHKLQLLIDQLGVYSEKLRREILELDQDIAIYKTRAVNEEQNGPGRPKKHIDENSMIYFRGLGFSWKEISQLLLVSRWTIHRRVNELGLNDVLGYTNIDDDELDEIVRNFKQSHGLASGRSMILGHLKSQGIRIQHQRVAKSLIRVDPESSRTRWALLIKRRKYNVPGPNSLWHIDGNHSLVNWGFVIHGAIDGYSRLITFLKCSCNNRKETVSELFEEAIIVHGIPSRIRTDKGGENVDIWKRIEELRGEHRGSYIAGPSVHNQRIERLWRDVWNHVTCNFYYTFQALEEEGLLDRTNQVHMFLLHYVYLPRINRVIESFIRGWNNHPLRTMKNWSPEKIWANGMLDLRNRGLHQVSELQDDIDATNNLEFYGVDWHAPNPTDDGLSIVDVDEIECPFDEVELEQLQMIQPLQESDQYGTDIFIDALNSFQLAL